MLTTDFSRIAPFVNAATKSEVQSVGGAGIGWLRDDDVVAGVLYEDYTGEGGSITAHIAVAPGAVMTREFIRTIFDYPFKQLRVGRIFATVASDNWKSHRLVAHMGFEPMTTVVGYYPDADMVIYVMTADKCRWLEN